MKRDELAEQLRQAEALAKNGASELDKRVKTLEHELADGGKVNDALSAKIVKIEAEIVKLQGERDAEKEKVKVLEGKMKEAAGDLGEKLKEREAELKKVKEEMGVMKKDLEARLASATKEAKVSNEALKRELYSVTEERDKIKARLQLIEKEMADSSVNASKEVKRLKEELDGMIKKKLEVEKELAKEKAKKADELKEKLEVAGKKIVELEDRIVALKSELDKTRKEAAKALAEVEANFKDELAAKLEELKAELLVRGSKDAESALQELKEKLAADKQAALDKLQAQHDADVARLQGAQGGLEQQMEELRKAHAAALQDLRVVAESDKAAAVERAEKTAASKVEEERTQAAAQREQLTQQHSTELASKDAQHSKAQEAAHQAADKALDAEKERAASKLGSEMERMLQERRASEDTLDSKHQSATEHLTAAHQQQVAGLEGQIEEASIQIAEMGRKIEGLEHEIDSLRKDVKQGGVDMVLAKERAAKDLKDEQSRLKREKKGELDAMLEEHIDETKSLHEEFTQAQQLMGGRNAQLQAQLEDVTDKYVNRASREEDLTRIKMLEDEIVQWGNKVKKLEEEMKFYKLELINREDNFNNKFGGGPNVGVIDPLSFGKKKDEKTRLPHLAANNGQRRTASFGSR